MGGSATSHLTVIWDRKENHDEVYEIRMGDSEHSRIDLLGVRADLFDKGSGWLEVLMQTKDGKDLWIRGKGMDDREQFLTLLDRLRPVTEDAWLAGLPADMVTWKESEQVARQILGGVPRPEGMLDTRTFELQSAQDYDSFALEVAQPWICDWFRAYSRAREGGHPVRMGEVAEVLGGSRDWEPLKQVSQNPGWPETVWKYADRAGEGLDVDGLSRDFAC